MRAVTATVAQDAHYAARSVFDVARIREDFPVLRQQIRGKPLVYLDNAATSQKPKQVVETIEQYYLTENSNVHRGIHLLSERATKAFEGARAKVARFLNARDAREIIFVRGATEGINLVAHSFARPLLSAGDEILISEMEHHSNIVPWQMVCEETGAVLRVVPINDDGELRLNEYERLFSARTRPPLRYAPVVTPLGRLSVAYHGKAVCCVALGLD